MGQFNKYLDSVEAERSPEKKYLLGAALSGGRYPLIVRTAWNPQPAFSKLRWRRDR